MRRNLKCASLIGLICSLTSLIQAQSVGQIRGRVIDAANQAAVADLTVVATAPGKDRTSKPTIVRATTDAKGQFAVEAPNIGAEYRLCIHGRQNILNPCQWEKPIVVKNGLDPDVTVAVSKGVLLRVLVSDPKNVLPQRDDSVATKDAPPVAISLVNPSTGARMPIPFARRDGSTTLYKEIIPIADGWEVRVTGGNFRMASDDGSELDGAKGVPIRIAVPQAVNSRANAGSAAELVATVTIVGRK